MKKFVYFIYLCFVLTPKTLEERKVGMGIHIYGKAFT